MVLPLKRNTNARTIPTPSRTPRTTPIAISHQNTPVAKLPLDAVEQAPIGPVGALGDGHEAILIGLLRERGE